MKTCNDGIKDRPTNSFRPNQTRTVMDIEVLRRRLAILGSQRGTYLLSLWIPPKDRIERVRRLIDSEEDTLRQRGGIYTQCRSVLQQARRILQLYDKTPKNGLVILCGMTEDFTTVTEYFEPPVPLTTSLYLIDKIFHVEIIDEALSGNPISA